MRANRGRGRLLAAAASMVMLVSFAGTTLAVSDHDVNGVVYKNGNWILYNTSRCMTLAGTYPRLNLFTWAGNNAAMYFYIRDATTGIALGSYTQASPLQFPLQNTGIKNFGNLAQTHCFKFAARKDGFIFASGTEDWTGNARY